MEGFNARNNNAAEHNQWKRIWNMTGPPKMKHFLWRACKGSLPVNVERHCRHWTDNPTCSRCNSADETVLHALLKCPSMNAVWSTYPAMSLLNHAPTSSFNECLEWLWSHATQDERDSALSLMWAAWFVRNKQVMTSESVDAVAITIGFSNLIRDYEMYARKVYRAHNPRTATQQQWSKPRSGWVKFNFDAHLGAGLHRGLAAVCRDENGELLAVGTKKYLASWDATTTEATVALYAMELATRMGYSHITLEGDAHEVISTIAKKEHGLTPIFLIYEKIFLLNSCFIGFECIHVSRKGNTVAHLAARREMNNVDEKICMNPFPQGIQALAVIDLS